MFNMTASDLEKKNIENGTRRLVNEAIKELNICVRKKKSVSWAEELEEVFEFEKPYVRGSYRTLLNRIGKARRIELNCNSM